MATDINLPLELSRRQKRVKRWIEWFRENLTSDAEKAKVNNLLKEYYRLLSQLNDPNAEGFSKAWTHLTDVERQLSTIFERSRLESRKSVVLD